MKDKKKFILSLLLAWLSMGCFYVTNNTYVVLGDLNEKLGGGINGWLYKIQCAVEQMEYEGCIVLLLLTVVYAQLLPKLDRALFKWSIPFGAVAGMFLVLCESYYLDNNAQRVAGNITAIILSVVRMTGIAVLFFFLFHFISQISLVLSEENAPVNKRKSFWITAGLIFLAWVPYLIVMFPGAVSPDATDEIAQIFGSKEYCWTEDSIILKNPDFLVNNHHPVFFTLILWFFVKLGGILGSYNWAMEIYCVLQCALFAMAISYFLIYMRELGISKKVYTGGVLFFALNPLFALWGVTVVKDTPFSILMLLVVVGFLKLINDKSEKLNKNCILQMVVLLLFMLTRNNGIYLLALMVVYAVVLFWKQKKQLKKMLLVLLIPMTVFQVGVQWLLLPGLGIAKGSSREVLSVPAQQLARTIKKHNDFTAEENAAVLAVFDGRGDKTVTTWANKYKADYADPVKNCYDKYTTTEELVAMIGVWLKGLVRHPVTYIQAFLNTNYGWFGLDCKTDGRYYNGEVGENLRALLPGLEQPEQLHSARKVVYRMTEIVSKLPFTMWMSEFSVYTWAHVICLLFMLRKKKLKELFCCGVSYFNYLICFLGPLSYARYAIPMMVCTPFVIILTFAERKEDTEMIPG